jgi:hypothetical protein
MAQQSSKTDDGSDAKPGARVTPLHLPRVVPLHSPRVVGNSSTGEFDQTNTGTEGEQ